MNKFVCLITTGKLEIQLRDSEPLLTELSAIQKATIEGDYAKAAIAFGRLSEISQKYELSNEATQNINLISDFFTTITAPLFSGGKVDEILALTVEELDFSVRDFNHLKRAGLNTLREILNTGSQTALELKTKLGKKGVENVTAKLKEYGFIFQEN